MTPLFVAILVVLNLGLIFLALAAPLGVRTVRMSRTIPVSRDRLWNALWPLGRESGWSGEYRLAEPVEGRPDRVRFESNWNGRDGKPIRRIAAIEEFVEGERFALRIVDDSSLDHSFWANYHETTELGGEDGAIRVTLTRTDRYRGLAVLAFRYFALRRQLGKLSVWARTGKYKPGGIFEHPLTQFGFAVLSALILWPLFGLTLGGLILASVLTFVVALHELGHMAAFRLMGHSNVRMIFVPLLGGVAIGGRPYDSRFEVAFVALMGAGFSAFLVPIAMVASTYARGESWYAASALLGTLAGCAALFNVANLVPVRKFDGGQVLRQIFPGPTLLALASFVLLSAFLGLGYLVGCRPWLLIPIGAIFAVLSLISAGGNVKPRHELKPIGLQERIAIGSAFLAVCTIHGVGLLWASSRLA